MLHYFIALIAIILGLISLGALYGNWTYLLLCLFKKKTHAPVFLIGGAFGAIALLIYPFHDFKAYCWVPIVLDPLSIYRFPAFIRICIMKKDQ